MKKIQNNKIIITHKINQVRKTEKRAHTEAMQRACEINLCLITNYLRVSKCKNPCEIIVKGVDFAEKD